MAKRVTAEVKQLAVEEYRKGRTLDELAEAADVDARTVARWVREAAAPVAPPIAPAPEAEAPAENAPPDEDEEFDPDDSLAFNRAIRKRMLREARSASAVGNHTAAQRFLRDAAGVANTIARLERDQRANADTLHVTRAEIDKAIEKVEERVKAIASRPLLCAQCSRALSIEMATDEKGEDENEPADGSEST